IQGVQLNPLKTGKKKIIKSPEKKSLVIKEELPTQEDNLINKSILEKPRTTQYLNFEKEYLPEPLPTVREEKLPTPIKRKPNIQKDNNTRKNIREAEHSSTQYLNFEEEHLPDPVSMPPPKKKPTNPQPNAYPAKEMPQTNQQATAEILAKSWAVQYGEMQGEQKLIARKLISDILFHGCLGNLEMSHAMRIQDILLNESVTNYYMDSQEAMDQLEPKIEYSQDEDIQEICSLNSEL
ncbi:hypothetical protein DOY81_011715, partial [Sarcophaga bullata]